MSTSDWIALGQLALSLIVGVLGVLGYFKLLRSADDNAKERKDEIERNAKERKEEIERNARERQEAIEETGRQTTAMIRNVTTTHTQQIRRQTIAVLCMFLWSVGIWLYTSKQQEKFKREMMKKEK